MKYRHKSITNPSQMIWQSSSQVEMLSFRPRNIQIEEIPITAFAYLGDAVFELYARLNSIYPPRTAKDYHQSVVARVRAENQAKLLDAIALTQAETDIVRRSRNATGNAPRNISANIYRKASGFEALIGYLYLTDPERLTQILTQTETNEAQE